jgi:putative ABC transport system ATP-binding protein
MNTGDSVLRVEQVTRRYAGTRSAPGFALEATTLELRAGSWTALSGRSGAGKSTLLNILSGLDRVDSGRVWMFGLDVTEASEDRLARVRRERIGVVHQQFRFIEYLPAWRNVTCRLVPAGVSESERRARAERVLDELGVGHAFDRSPLELSGGEQQRVALARAVVAEPQVLIADEPTSNVDSETGAMIVRYMQGLQARGTTIVVSTHDASLLAPATQRFVLAAGRIEP